jgi:cation transport ATPase
MNQPPAKVQNGGKLPALSDDTVRQLIAQQAQEATLRSQELQIRKAELDHQSKHALEILAAQERDREKERMHQRTVDRNKMIFLGTVLAAIVAFSCFGLYLNKDGIVRDILQTVLGVVLGSVGGYGYARVQQKREDRADKDDD